MGKPKNLKEALFDPAGAFREPEKPDKVKPPKMPDFEALEKDAEAAMRERIRKRRGRAGTILTGGGGLSGEPTILNKQVLG